VYNGQSIGDMAAAVEEGAERILGKVIGQ